VPVILQSNTSIAGTVVIETDSQIVVQGAVVISGNLTIADGGTLTLNASTSGALTVFGCANLSGVLNVYVDPTKYQNIEVIRSACLNGSFAKINGISSGPCYQVSDHSVFENASSLAVTFTLVQVSCSAEDKTLIPGLSRSVSIAVIVVSVLGVVILAVVILIAIPTTRQRIFPFAARKRFVASKQSGSGRS